MYRSILPLFSAAALVSAPAFASEVVPVGQFSSIQLRAGGDAMIVPGPVQRVTLLNGSTEFTSFRVRNGGRLEISTECNRRCPRNYNLRIQIESPHVPDVAVQAGGTIVARPGFAAQRKLSAAVSAGGTIDLRSVAAENVSAAVNAGGDIYVRPSATLQAAVNAGGDIHYVGHPRVSMAIANGGDVRRIN